MTLALAAGRAIPGETKTKSSDKMNATQINPNEITMRMNVCFFPLHKTGQEIQDIAEATGAKLLGGSSANGMLTYEATGFAIGKFRAAIAAIGLSAVFAA